MLFRSASKLRWPEPLAESQFAGGWSHSLGLQAGGKLLVWGDNRSGAVISGSSVVAEPVAVSLPGPAVRLAAGDWQSYAVDANGVVWQWGDPNGPTPPWPGEVQKDFSVPTTVPLPLPIREIAAGGSHALAIAADGRLWTWGHNYFGELGHEGTVDDLPQIVPGRFAAACGGWSYSLALDTNGQVYSWGWNEFGQLGRGGSPETPARVELPEGIRFRAVAAGGVHSLALSEDGVVWGWGYFGSALGLAGTGSGIPSPVEGLPPIRKVVCGADHSLALAENGEVWFFGTDPNTGSAVFGQVSTLTNVVNIGAGMWHSFALDADGDLFIWGSDLAVIGGAGEAAQLTLVNSIPLIQAHTNYVTVTNIVEEERIEEQLQPVVVTNAMPVYRDLNRHWLDVVDYQGASERPAVREPVSLPGSLQGISHGGALLYTLAGAFDDSPSRAQATRLAALAYDGISAHLVDTILLAADSNERAAHVGVDPSGVVVVVTNDTANSSLACWALNSHGKIEQLGRIELRSGINQDQVPSDALRLIDGLAILRTTEGIELVDFGDPSAPVALSVNESLGASATDIRRAAGSRQLGLWLPAGEAGPLVLWRP